MTITVYSKPQCVQCTGVKRWLDKRGIKYAEVDVSKSPDDLAAIKALGYTGVPVTIVSGREAGLDLHWYGLDVNNLAKYTTKEMSN